MTPDLSNLPEGRGTGRERFALHRGDLKAGVGGTSVRDAAYTALCCVETLDVCGANRRRESPGVRTPGDSRRRFARTSPDINLRTRVSTEQPRC